MSTTGSGLFSFITLNGGVSTNTFWGYVDLLVGQTLTVTNSTVGNTDFMMWN